MDSSGNLIPGSPLVSDINCMRPGGATDYADAMEAAYNELNLHNGRGVQKIIVLLSDGAANFGQNCVTTQPVNGKQVKDTRPALHPAVPVGRQRRRHLQGPGHPDLHHPLRRPNHRPRLPRLHRRKRSPLPTALDSHAGHRQPRTTTTPIPTPTNLDRHLPTNRLRHGRRHQPHRQLAGDRLPGPHPLGVADALGLAVVTGSERSFGKAHAVQIGRLGSRLLRCSNRPALDRARRRRRGSPAQNRSSERPRPARPGWRCRPST